MTDNEIPKLDLPDVTIPRGLFASGGWCAPTANVYDGLFGLPSEMTAEARAKRDAALRESVRKQVARYHRVVATLGESEYTPANAALLRIAYRHAPVDHDWYAECACHHESGYEWEPGEWPCQDFEDVARAVRL